MNPFLRFNSLVYHWIALLYPADLRRVFGSEIALAFADDLESAWQQRRVAGVARVWWRALRELLTVVLPGHISNPSIVVPLLSFTMALLTWGTSFCFALHKSPHVAISEIVDALRFSVLLPSFANALVAVVVTRVAAYRSMTALQLD